MSDTEQYYAPNFETTYYVDGFRSLRDFSICLKPGLNVLVGPNGAGKTNFIEFLDFFHGVLGTNASMAVSNAGGLAKVFSLEINKKKTPKIVAKVDGFASTDGLIDKEQKGKVFKFKHEIEIKFSRTHSAMYISKESVRIFKLHSPEESGASRALVGEILVTRASPLQDVRPKWRIGPRLRAKNSRNPMQLADRYLTSRQREMDIIDRIELLFVDSDESFLGIRHSIRALDLIRQSIVKRRSINIIPDRAKVPDDLTTPPYISRDGSGLSAVLHAMQAVKRSPNSRKSVRVRALSAESLDNVISLTRLVFPNLTDITVSSDPQTGKYLGFLVVEDGEAIRIPLSNASDGTLKWLCLVSLLASPGGIYSLEEPENFLHPKMLQYLAQIMRDSINIDDGIGDIFIVSTHSETFINCCIPDELIMFSFCENRTTCSRVQNSDRVREEINRTGFGLGYYYASNALS